MTELRKDPVADRWVIIAPDRAHRPITTSVTETGDKKGGDPSNCPFCEGFEHLTPSEVFSCRKEGSEANQPGWSLRVVPNKYPALKTEGEPALHKKGLYEKMDGIGYHEVIIESPLHSAEFSTLPVNRVAETFMAARERIRFFKRDDRITFTQFFKNHGARAGASMPHIHSQIIALPIAPKSLSEEIRHAEKKRGDLKRCVYCKIIETEIGIGDRIVFKNSRFVAYAPYAPRFAYELWITPKRHCAGFEYIDDTELSALAEIVKNVMMRINRTLDYPAYNMMLISAPFASPDAGSFHWRLELAPSISRVAGFELGAGMHINTVPPEEAARILREVEL